MLCLIRPLQVCAPNKVEAQHIFKEIWERRVYLRRGVSLEEGAVVIDIGAHVGLFALFVASQLEQVQLVCVEPSTESCEALKSNLQLHCPTEKHIVNHKHLLGLCLTAVVPAHPSIGGCWGSEEALYILSKGAIQLHNTSSGKAKVCICIESWKRAVGAVRYSGA